MYMYTVDITYINNNNRIKTINIIVLILFIMMMMTNHKDYYELINFMIVFI